MMALAERSQVRSRVVKAPFPDSRMVICEALTGQFKAADEFRMPLARLPAQIITTHDFKYVQCNLILAAIIIWDSCQARVRPGIADQQSRLAYCGWLWLTNSEPSERTAWSEQCLVSCGRVAAPHDAVFQWMLAQQRLFVSVFKMNSSKLLTSLLICHDTECGEDAILTAGDGSMVMQEFADRR